MTKKTAEEAPQKQLHWNGVAVLASAWNRLPQQRQCNNKAQPKRRRSSGYTEAAIGSTSSSARQGRHRVLIVTSAIDCDWFPKNKICVWVGWWTHLPAIPSSDASTTRRSLHPPSASPHPRLHSPGFFATKCNKQARCFIVQKKTYASGMVFQPTLTEVVYDRMNSSMSTRAGSQLV